MTAQQRFLTKPALVLITIVAIINLRNIPMMAEQGPSVLWNYAIAAIAFLIPSALISAQSASQMPEAGGVYHWVQKAFGDRWGFFSIWSEWFNNLIGFPATLLFICDTVLQAIMPHQQHLNLILMITMLVLLWLVTALNCKGIALSTKISSVGAVVGTIIPATVISIIALCYHQHHHIHWHLVTSHHNFSATLAVLVTCMAGYSGMQVTAFHTPNIIKPRQTLPRALLISIGLILVLTILPTLAVMMVVPHQQLNMITGIWQCLLIFFNHQKWLANIILACICFGSLAALLTWMLAPARGLLQSTKDNFLPKYFAKINNKESPARILVLQAIIVSLFIAWLYCSQHLAQGFWILAVLTSQFTLIMYCFIFAAAIKNRWALSVPKDGFEMPKLVTIVTALLGITSCILGYILSFHKPSFLIGLSTTDYHHDLTIATTIYILVPIYFIIKRKSLLPD
jgi:amino acid transporter